MPSEESTQSIEIDADPADVMAVIADFANYPQWTGSVRKAEVLEGGPGGRARRVAFTLDAGIVRDEYELAYVWTGNEKVEWELVQGQMMRSQRGSYVLRSDGAGRTHVTYSLAVELAIPMLGLLKRKAERVVMDTALKELKKRVETLKVGH
ncbi:MAG TPA: SRPBCC family protein [Jatrophihabitans sp.]|nr:SRPBCC family protein [Jatrophihabitans sp.]